MAKVVITARNFDDLTPDATQRLRDAGHEVTLFADGMSMPPDAYFEAISGAQAVLVSLEHYDRALLERLPSLRLISRRGVGVDTIDTDYCVQHNIAIARTLGLVEGSVAEYAIACVFYFARRLHEQNAPMHAGQWQRILTPGAKTRTIGLVGFGGIGTQIARRAAALDMQVLYTARHRRAQLEEARYGAVYCPFHELLSQSDYVIACVPLTPQTTGLFDAAAFSCMKPGAVFINVARAGVAVEDDLYAALSSTHLCGAAIDVHPCEPCVSRFAGLSNVLLTPHTAPYTTENFAGMNRAAAQHILDFFKEHPEIHAS